MRPLGIDNNTVKKTSGHACQKSFENTLSGKFTATSFIGLPVEVNRSWVYDDLGWTCNFEKQNSKFQLINKYIS